MPAVKRTIFTCLEMPFFQNFMYWFKCSPGQGCPWSALSKLSDRSGVGLELPIPFLPTPAQELPREARLCAQPPLHGRGRGTHTSARASTSQVIPPSLHFSRCLESILFCSHSAPGPNPFQCWLWATIYNEIQMSVTYGKSDSH